MGATESYSSSLSLGSIAYKVGRTIPVFQCYENWQRWGIWYTHIRKPVREAPPSSLWPGSADGRAHGIGNLPATCGVSAGSPFICLDFVPWKITSLYSSQIHSSHVSHILGWFWLQSCLVCAYFFLYLISQLPTKIIRRLLCMSQEWLGFQCGCLIAGSY